MKYDVFISYKHDSLNKQGTTRDYTLAYNLHQKLLANGISAFFSEKDLLTAVFRDEIDRALDSARIIIVVGTQPEHIESRWVKYEWQSFQTDLLQGIKKGYIYTYLEGMTLYQLPRGLRNFRSYNPFEVDKMIKRIKRDLVKLNTNKKNSIANVIKLAIAVIGIFLTISLAVFFTLYNQKRNLFEIKSTDDVLIGQHLYFGTYEQDDDINNGAEEIEWRVLDKDGDKLLLITEKILADAQYSDSDTLSDWENSTIRKWLNEGFYNTAFDSNQKQLIQLMNIKNPDNQETAVDGGNDTQDRVFLLNIDEADRYFSSNNDRRAELTKSVIAYENGVGRIYYYPNGLLKYSHPWYLRAPGISLKYVASVQTDGEIGHNFHVVNEDNIGIRPAIWVKI